MRGGTSGMDAFLIEPEKWAFEAAEVTLDEERLRALIDRPDPALADNSVVLTLLELVHGELQERATGEEGLIDDSQLRLVFRALLAAAARSGWTE